MESNLSVCVFFSALNYTIEINGAQEMYVTLSFYTLDDGETPVPAEVDGWIAYFLNDPIVDGLGNEPSLYEQGLEVCKETSCLVHTDILAVTDFFFTFSVSIPHSLKLVP